MNSFPKRVDVFYFWGGGGRLRKYFKMTSCLNVTQRNEHLCCRFLFGEFETYFVAKLFQSKDSDMQIFRVMSVMSRVSDAPPADQPGTRC